ncbi:hypothetical protein SSX86_014559 [Deinandra increscens subsp. villosa]|uniref:Aldose 1-epimerase n=1 Tax=Deinandra increscens subsp. villosa TaxID=3103831 RepID=A0AAP0D675_9ASTR
MPQSTVQKPPPVFCFIITIIITAVFLWGGDVDASKHEDLEIYELNNGYFSIKCTNWGAAIISVFLPDKNGEISDVVLGYDSVKTYKNDSTYFGSVVGRVANRIGGAKFTLNGTSYKLDFNEHHNMLHGGHRGFSDVVWKVIKHQKDGKSPSITFAYHSFDGEEGFPGDLKVMVTYSLVGKYKLRVKMVARPGNKATPVNLAQHTYWNLGGHNTGDILSEKIQIFGSHITPTNDELIPTGEIVSVKGTPYDLLQPSVIKKKIKGLPSGYDINYVLDAGKKSEKPKMNVAAIVWDKKSGRSMTLKTDAPGVQFYTGNYVKDVKGKGGYVYEEHAGLCLETQGFPDAVNHPNFPSQIVNPGETYKHRMLFKFSIDGKTKTRKLINCSVKQNSQIRTSTIAKMSTENTKTNKKKKEVWIWTENKQVLTAAVERGWNTFIFSSLHRQIATDWSSITLICPLFIEEARVFNEEAKLVATFSEISSPEQLEQLQPLNEGADNVIVDLLDWQVIPAENIVAAFHGHHKTVFAVSKSPSEAQIFFEALEQGLGGVVLKTENVEDVLELKSYFDRRNQEGSQLGLTKATITGVEMTGMGDRVCVDLCSLMKPGEGVLVGSFARGLFLVHSECLESNYLASRPFRVNAGPVHAYVAIPGGKTCYLSELKTGKEILVVDQNGIQRTAVVGRVKIETRPLVIVTAKVDSDEETSYSILLQNAETVGLVPANKGLYFLRFTIPVTSLKVGDQVLLKLQGGARHTGIEIQEFIVEK